MAATARRRRGIVDFAKQKFFAHIAVVGYMPVLISAPKLRAQTKIDQTTRPTCNRGTIAGAGVMPTLTSPPTTTTRSVLRLVPVLPGSAEVTLAPGPVTLGSAAECDVLLHPTGIAGLHATIITDERRSVVVAHDERCWLNDGPVKQAVLHAGDRLAVGPVEFRLEPGPGETPFAPIGAPQATPATIESRPHDPIAPPPQPAAESPSGPDAQLRLLEELLAQVQRQSQGLRRPDSALQEAVEADTEALRQRQAELSQRAAALESEWERIAALDERTQAAHARLEERLRILEQRETAFDERAARSEVQSPAVDAGREVDRGDGHPDDGETAFGQAPRRVEESELQWRRRHEELDVQYEQLRREREALDASRAELQASELELQACVEDLDRRVAGIDERLELAENTEAALRQRSVDADRRDRGLQQKETELHRREEDLKQRATVLYDQEQAVDDFDLRRRELDGMQSELQARSDELDRRSEEILAEQTNRRDVEDTLQQQQRAFDERLEALESRERDLTARQEHAAAREREWEQRCAEFEVERARVHELAESLQGRAEELDSEDRAFEAQRQQSSVEREQLAEWQQRLESLDGDISAENEQLDRIRAELEAQREEMRGVRETIAADRRQIADSDREFAERDAALQSVREELAERERELESARNQLHRERAEFDAQSQRLAEEREDLDAFRAAIDNDRESAAAAHISIDARLAEIDAREREIEDRALLVHAELAGLKRQRDDLTGEQARIEVLRRCLDDDHTIFEGRQAELEQQREALRERQSQLESRECELAAARESLEQSEQSSADARQTSETERTACVARQTAPADERSLVAAGRRELVEHQTLLENRLQQADAREWECRRRESELAERELRLIERERNLERLSQAEANGLAELDAVREDLQHERRERERRSEELADWQASLNVEREVLNSLQGELDEREANIAESRAETDRDKAELQRHREAVESERETLLERESKLDELKQELEERQRAAAVERSELETWAERLQHRERELSAESERLQPVRLELQQREDALKRDLERLEEQRRELGERRSLGVEADGEAVAEGGESILDLSGLFGPFNESEEPHRGEFDDDSLDEPVGEEGGEPATGLGDFDAGPQIAPQLAEQTDDTDAVKLDVEDVSPFSVDAIAIADAGAAGSSNRDPSSDRVDVPDLFDGSEGETDDESATAFFETETDNAMSPAVCDVQEPDDPDARDVYELDEESETGPDNVPRVPVDNNGDERSVEMPDLSDLFINTHEDDPEPVDDSEDVLHAAADEVPRIGAPATEEIGLESAKWLTSDLLPDDEQTPGESSAETVAKHGQERSTVAGFMSRFFGRKRKREPESAEDVAKVKQVEQFEPAEIEGPPTTTIQPDLQTLEPELRPAATRPEANEKTAPGDKNPLFANYDTMREIANTSARSAIATSTWKRLRPFIRLKATLVALLLFVSVALLASELWLDISLYQYGVYASYATAVAGISLMMTIVQGRRRSQAGVRTRPASRKRSRKKSRRKNS
ncbi:MAG: FHA domain-containing protein [Planctomycetaceae bacterium]